MNETNPTRRDAAVLCLAGALAMSFGWGFRGDYGHEFGAMVPGALLAMAVCLASGRTAWFRRCVLMGACGAIGWAFGGSQSYGQITSYTVSHSWPDVYFGYACLFTVGMLWGGIGCGVLSLALTKKWSELECFIGPVLTLGIIYFLTGILLETAPALRDGYERFTELRLHDTDWLAATLALLCGGLCWLLAPKSRTACYLMMAMAVGWWIGYLFLVQLLGLEMSPTPPGDVRSENWGGCAGMLVALIAYHLVQQNRAALMLLGYGAMAGGIGFSVGDFINKPDKVRWEPFWNQEWLRGFDHWKWSEQCFGLIMGLGVAIGLLRLLRGNLKVESGPGGSARLNDFCAFIVLVVVLWKNLRYNVSQWAKPHVNLMPSESLLGLPAPTWYFFVGALLTALVLYALYLHRQGALPFAPASPQGKGQLVFLFVIWVCAAAVLLKAVTGMGSKGLLFVHASFWISSAICTGLVLVARSKIAWSSAPEVLPVDLRWRLGWRHWVLWVLMLVLIGVLTVVTLSMHDEPMPGSRLRFGPNAWHLVAVD